MWHVPVELRAECERYEARGYKLGATDVFCSAYFVSKNNYLQLLKCWANFILDT